MLLKFVRLAIAITLGVALAACATMSPQQCRLANWSDVGLRDGLDGKAIALLATRADDCAESGVTIDSAAYLKGRENGLRSYCRLENAVPLGLNGGNYENVCPPQIDAEFRRRFQLGHNVLVARAEFGRLDQRIQAHEQRLRQLDRDEDRRLHDADKEDDRRRIRREIDDERRHVRDELRDLDHRQRRVRDNLRDAEWALGGLR